MDTAILKEIAERCNNHNILKELEIIEKNKDTLKIALLGRFSSGKSSLVNSLFNISYLPIRDNETTSKITFIEYGEIDRSYKIMDNGAIVEIPLEVFTKITTTFPKEELEKILYLKLELNNPLIKGITFMDTPGISGLNKFTKEVVYNYLPNIDFAIYTVFETGFNTDDLNFLELSKNYLAHILPIINKAELVTKERDVNFAFYEKQWQNLFDVEKRHPLFFCSPESDFDYNNKGNQALKDYIFNLIKNEREILKAQSFDKKLTKLKYELIQDIENRKYLLELSETDKEFKTKLLKSESELSKLNLEQTELSIKVNGPIRQANEKFLNCNFDETIISQKKKFKDNLENLEFNQLKKDFNRSLEIILKETGEVITSEWNSKLIEAANNIIKELGQEFDNNINELVSRQISNNFTFNIPINEINFYDLESLISSQSDKKQELFILMSELEKRLQEEKINVQDLIDEQKEIENHLTSVQTDYREVLNQVRNVRQLDPMYQEIIDDKALNTGKFFGKVLGEATDLALIFLPGTQIKLVEPLMKAGKLINVSEKIIEKVQKVENGMNKIKNVSNDVYARLKKNKRVKGSETFKSFSNFMSNFTFSTWGERLGGTVGSLISPPTISRIIDPNWEEDQKRQLSILQGELNVATEQLQHTIGNKFQKEKGISVIKHEMNSLSAQLEQYQSMIKEIEREEQNERLNAAQKRENHLIQLYKNIDETFSNLRRELRLMLNISSENLSGNLSEKITLEVKKQIETIKRTIQDTNNFLDASISDRTTQIQELTSQLKSLKELS